MRHVLIGGLVTLSGCATRPAAPTPEHSGESPAPKEHVITANWEPSYSQKAPEFDGGADAMSDAEPARPSPELLALVEYLASIDQNSGVFDAGASAEIDSARVLALVSARGLQITDVNRRDGNAFAKPGEIRRQLDAGRGRVFVALAHVGHIYFNYAQNFRRDREFTSVTQTGESAVVSLGLYYELHFAKEAGVYKLVRCDYLKEEGH